MPPVIQILIHTRNMRLVPQLARGSILPLSQVVVTGLKMVVIGLKHLHAYIALDAWRSRVRIAIVAGLLHIGAAGESL